MAPAKQSATSLAASAKGTNKRRPTDNPDRSISPPPLKRKAQSAISKSAVASFFTPTSQKPKDRTTWTERSPNDDTPATLLVAKYTPEEADQTVTARPPVKRRKIAAFDLDSTLITSASGKVHAGDAVDWKWWHHSVSDRLRQLYNDEGQVNPPSSLHLAPLPPPTSPPYLVTIFTNQGGLTLHPDPKSKAPKSISARLPSFKQKCSTVLNQLNIPITLYAATGKDIFRKPRMGMWSELKDDYDLAEEDIDREHSIFVGDAGGRTITGSSSSHAPKDFSCSDRNLAENIGIKYQTPEEFFLGEEPRVWQRDFDLKDFPFPVEEEDEIRFGKKNDKEVVLFVGSPGAGKSTFFWKHLKELGYKRVNQDTLKSKEKCIKAAADYLEEGDSVVVDNTNPDPDIRAQWIQFAAKHKVPIRCVWFKTPVRLCEHNDAVRSMSKAMNPESRQALPKLAFNFFAARFKEPKVKEGFQDIFEVEFRFRGTREEYDIWGRYWL
ncbi:polynucleotide kinase 3 phosphatase-domain-containing protein [Bombardia bombarda]|uniref:Polynucleotide kinase 3 phosphatase-domain-containing protein n=1 Tax=Bombardia bombarda TaxID=252184 RepID=A0AA39X190_9PEZI|nr:polynucleotide kinase 3 phosphatase-domain-containing protein [Bombardia bombarda]